MADIEEKGWERVLPKRHVNKRFIQSCGVSPASESKPSCRNNTEVIEIQL